MIYHYLLENARSPGHSDLGTIEQAFQAINTAVCQAAEESSGLQGMGTTLLIARVVDDMQLQIGSVGDSRAYHLSDGTLHLLTHDHTWVDEIGVPLGLTEEELRHHPMKHVLTMAIGTSQELRVHSSVRPMKAGDQVLLCSDGLHRVVMAEELATLLNTPLPAQEKCRLLVEAAKQRGGPDNVTVVLIYPSELFGTHGFVAATESRITWKLQVCKCRSQFAANLLVAVQRTAVQKEAA
jgi:protein phosphatase